MAATSGPSNATSPTRTRLPQTPRVTSSRRGVHAPIRSETVERQGGAPAAPAMHMTPDVIIAARGDLALADTGRRLAKSLDTSGLELRRLRN